MIKDEIEPAETASPNILVEQTEQLRCIFPQAFSEGKIDFEKLRATLGEMVDNQPERYSFTWAGKRSATLLLQTPSYATLTPTVDESVNFENTQNLFIEGDNFEVLKLLYKSYSGQVKMIYLDPPYNTGNDFVYPDNFTDPLNTYLKVTGQKDAEGNLLTSNPETSGRYHSAWLSMMYPRLFLARQLLKDDGVIFISIDDHEMHNLRFLMNEVFGEENFLAVFVWKRRSGAMDAVNNVSSDHEYVLCYGKNSASLIGEQRTFERYANPDNDLRGPWVADNLSAAKPGGDTLYPVKDPDTGYEYWPPKGRYWPYNPATMARKIREGRIIFPKTSQGTPLLKRFQSEAKSLFRPVSTWIAAMNGGNHRSEASPITLTTTINSEGTREMKELFGDKVFLYPKPVSLLRSLIKQGTTGEEDIVLDFFAGSCTTAQAVLELNHEDGQNRRFIMVQLPEPTGDKDFPTISDIGKERIRRVIKRIQQENKGKLDLPPREIPEDLGFRVFKMGASNYTPWEGTQTKDADIYTAQLELLADPLKDGWTPENVIWEVAIKEGYGLNSHIRQVDEIEGNTVYRVTDPDKEQLFLICLDNEITLTQLKTLALTASDLFICRDIALNDETAANLALQCRLKTI
jgi:adenine-specific DNA-methyltransferase